MKLSVCIPTYNGARYLKECIESVLGQSYPNFELLIIDDQSKDNTKKIIERFDDNRIKFYRNETRLGLVCNWNKCIEHANGEFINIFHQDDVMSPRNLSEKVKILEENHDVGFVYSDVYRINECGDVIADHWFYETQQNTKNYTMEGSKFFSDLIAGDNLVCCPGVMVKKKCFDHLNGFDERLPFTADWEMWLRISLFYDVAYLKDPLIKYRVHNKNETNNFNRLEVLEQYYKSKLLGLTKYPEKIPDQNELIEKLIKEYEKKAINLSQEHYEKGNNKIAMKGLALAFKIYTDGVKDNNLSQDYILWYNNQLQKLHDCEIKSTKSTDPSSIPAKELLNGLFTKLKRKLNQNIQILVNK